MIPNIDIDHLSVFLSIYLHTKSTQEKTIALEGSTIRLTTNFSTAITEVCKQWSSIFSELKDSSCHVEFYSR